MPQNRVFFVKCEHDREAGVWYVAQSDVPGLNAEAETPAQMIDILEGLVPALLEANGVIEDDDGLPDIPYNFMFQSVIGQRDGRR